MQVHPLKDDNAMLIGVDDVQSAFAVQGLHLRLQKGGIYVINQRDTHRLSHGTELPVIRHSNELQCRLARLRDDAVQSSPALLAACHAAAAQASWILFLQQITSGVQGNSAPLHVMSACLAPLTNQGVGNLRMIEIDLSICLACNEKKAWPCRKSEGNHESRPAKHQ